MSHYNLFNLPLIAIHIIQITYNTYKCGGFTVCDCELILGVIYILYRISVQCFYMQKMFLFVSTYRYAKDSCRIM